MPPKKTTSSPVRAPRTRDGAATHTSRKTSVNRSGARSLPAPLGRDDKAPRRDRASKPAWAEQGDRKTRAPRREGSTAGGRGEGYARPARPARSDGAERPARSARPDRASAAPRGEGRGEGRWGERSANAAGASRYARSSASTATTRGGRDGQGGRQGRGEREEVRERPPRPSKHAPRQDTAMPDARRTAPSRGRREEGARDGARLERPQRAARPTSREPRSDYAARGERPAPRHFQDAPRDDARSPTRDSTRPSSPRRSAASRTPFRKPIPRVETPVLTEAERHESGERVQKVLAQLGWGARREIEDWIRAGDVWINGELATLGAVLVRGDRVEVIRGQKDLPTEGKRARRKEVERFITWHPDENKLPRVLLYHKPEGEIISRDDPQNRPSSFTNLPRLKGSRWVNIGRLDVASSGLLLFTDDGELAHKIMHPSSNLEREYAVRINGTLSEEHIRQLLAGVELEDGIALCNSVAPMSMKNEGRNQWYKLILTEGKNREIRRMVEALGYQVSRLMRVRYGPVFMPRGLRRGKHEELERASVEKLLRLLETH